MRKLIGIVLVCCVVASTAVGMDYYNQWRLKDYAPGQMGATDYKASLMERMGLRPKQVPKSGVERALAETIGRIGGITPYNPEKHASPMPQAGGVVVNRHNRPTFPGAEMKSTFEGVEQASARYFQQEGMPEGMARFVAGFNAQFMDLLIDSQAVQGNSTWSDCQQSNGVKRCSSRD